MHLNSSEWRQYSPIHPPQTYRIPSIPNKNDVKSFHLDRENLDSFECFEWNYLDQIISIKLFGSNYWDLIIWIKLSGSNCLDQIVWIKLSGSNYLDQIIWIKLSGSNYLVQIIWIKLFWILWIILNYFHINFSYYFFILTFHITFKSL